MIKLNPLAAAFIQLVLEVFRINGLPLAAGDQLTQPVGLSSARWHVRGVVEHAPISLAHVGHTLGLTRQSVQQTVDGLAKDGFITYSENPHHRRSKRMQLTTKGRDSRAYVAERQATLADQIGEMHTLEGLQTAIHVLRQVHTSLDVSMETNDHETEPSQSYGR